MPKSLIERREALIRQARELLPSEGEKMSPEVAEQVRGLMDDADGLADEISAAKKSADLVAKVKAAAEVDGGANESVGDAVSLGDHFVKHAGDKLGLQSKGSHIAYSTPEFEMRAASDPLTSPVPAGAPDLSAWGTEFRRDIVNARRERLVVADLMGAATTALPTIAYMVEKEKRIAEGEITTVAEGAKKPFVRFELFDIVTEHLSKIAALTKITEEMAADYAFVSSWINSQLIYELSVVEEAQLLNGDGNGSNLTGLLNREGLQQFDISGNLFDGLFTAAQKVPEVTELQADALVLNPADYVKLRLAKDSNGQYLAGGPFTGQYGNGGVLLNPSPWGLRTVDTPAIAEGKYVLGAFRQASTVLRKGGLRVDSTNSNADDFEHNLITLRAEERLGLMVTRPGAFVTGSITGAAA